MQINAVKMLFQRQAFTDVFVNSILERGKGCPGKEKCTQSYDQYLFRVIEIRREDIRHFFCLGPTG